MGDDMTGSKMRLAAAAALTAILSACSVGPDYKQPPAVVPAAYKEANGWQVAQPNDGIDRGAWWSIYDDPMLDQLERQVDISNQTLKAAEAAYRQAVAVVAEGRSGYLPTLAINGSADLAKSAGAISSPTTKSHGEYSAAASLDWDLDIWGRIRRTVESNKASAQASAADLAVARLSAQATLATDYFELRIADESARLLSPRSPITSALCRSCKTNTPSASPPNRMSPPRKRSCSRPRRRASISASSARPWSTPSRS
jgi:outer membrane protein TolC